ncbi:hypothetical protein BOTBODRAFT_28209 [Botryobasidium botryosum FD-172 SS1]|uniref:F-box domain-containing protein n=1 Tax=Botryobasidium botryosum (strain FD-172 SS1) TaxID=930990 RepID=A0A067MY61_BOTB1|nr:hypothetical protein BOTBODRAFT_28209 [Botryobasidium botryosum FD-172 SS1]
MSLDAFPTEIVQDIFQSACLDDGRTARALCLVSRRYNDLAKPLLFRSIAVCGIAQMEVFAGLLQQNPDVARSVRYLFLSENENDRAPREEGDGASAGVIPPTIEEANAFQWLSVVIFRSLTPTLEVLSYVTLPHSQGRVRVRCLFTEPWQRLRELMVHEGRLDLSFHWLPSLTHLHIHTNFLMYDGLPRMFGFACPQLTHLKISGLYIHGRELADNIEEAWATDPPEGEPDREVPSPVSGKLARLPRWLPLPLRHIILQPVTLIQSRTASWPPLNRVMRARLNAFAEAGRARGVVVQGMEAESMDKDVQEICAQAKREWLERLDGGAGCWMVEGGDATEVGAEVTTAVEQLDLSPGVAAVGHQEDSGI